MTAQPKREQPTPREAKEQTKTGIDDIMNEWIDLYETAEPDAQSDIQNYLQTNLDSLNEIQQRTDAAEAWSKTIDRALQTMDASEEEVVELTEDMEYDPEEDVDYKEVLELYTDTLQSGDEGQLDNIEAEAKKLTTQGDTRQQMVGEALLEKFEKLRNGEQVNVSEVKNALEQAGVDTDDLEDDVNRAEQAIEDMTGAPQKSEEEQLDEARDKVKEVADKVAGYASEGKFDRKGSSPDRLEKQEYSLDNKSGTPDTEEGFSEAEEAWFEEGERGSATERAAIADEIGVDVSGLRELRKQWQRVKENSELIVDQELRDWVESPESSWDNFVQADPDQGFFKKIGGFFSGDTRTKRQKMSDRMAEAYYQVADKTADVSKKLDAQQERQKKIEKQSKKTGGGSMT